MTDREKSIAHAHSVADDEEIAERWEQRRLLEEQITALKQRMEQIDAWIDARAAQLKKDMPMKKTTAKKTAAKDRPVIVTTAHRGVFFGYATDTDGETIALKRARLCVYWSADVKGFMGLAANGPTAACRIGPAADIKLRNITAVLSVTPAAVAAWEAAPWK